jgi:hypothetical protein
MLPPGPRVIFIIMPKLSFRPFLLSFGSLWMETGDALSFTQFGFLGNNQRAASQRLINYNSHTEFNFEPFSLTFRFGVDFEQVI